MFLRGRARLLNQALTGIFFFAALLSWRPLDQRASVHQFNFIRGTLECQLDVHFQPQSDELRLEFEGPVLPSWPPNEPARPMACNIECPKGISTECSLDCPGGLQPPIEQLRLTWKPHHLGALSTYMALYCKCAVHWPGGAGIAALSLQASRDHPPKTGPACKPPMHNTACQL